MMWTTPARAPPGVTGLLLSFAFVTTLVRGAFLVFFERSTEAIRGDSPLPESEKPAGSTDLAASRPASLAEVNRMDTVSVFTYQ